MELWLVADTNLFFECKPLEQLPWAELNADTVVVLLTKPVLDEIDKHKKGVGRTRDRAIDIFGLVRAMLHANETEHELLPSSPRVLIRLESARPNPSLKDSLDYDRNDDKLVGIVSTLASATTDRAVALFTDDTGPASTAKGIGVPFRLINASWRRPASESTEAKKIKDLEKDLATYRAQEPQIQIDNCEGAGPKNLIEVSRRVADALPEAEIEELLASLRAKHPPKTDFAPPAPTSVVERLSGQTVHTAYRPPADEAVREYLDDLYPRWIAQCRGVLTTLHEGSNKAEPTLVVRWPMSNVGTRPASHVRIEFEAQGPLGLVRLREEEDADADDSDSLMADNSPQAVSTAKLPSPPRPPAFRMDTTHTSPPLGSMIPGRQDDWTASSVAKMMAGKDLLSKYKPAAALGLMDSAASLAVMKGAARHFAKMSEFMPQHGVASATMMPSTFELPRMPSLPQPRDREAFYWDWPMDRAVTKGALTCELWRHQGQKELFTFAVKFDREGEARGTVECTVHAGNLTKPEQARVIVGRTIERFSVKELAAAMVKACS